MNSLLESFYIIFWEVLGLKKKKYFIFLFCIENYMIEIGVIFFFFFNGVFSKFLWVM